MACLGARRNFQLIVQQLLVATRRRLRLSSKQGDRDGQVHQWQPLALHEAVTTRPLQPSTSRNMVRSVIRRVADQVGHWLTRVSLVPPPRTAILLASGASKQRDWSRSRVEVVCSEPLIIVVHNLLCQAECRAIIEATQRYGRPMMAGAVDARDLKYNLATWPLEDAHPSNETAPLLEAVYDRIDAMCGIARQLGEVPPKVVFSAPSSEALPQRHMPLGLHVDTNAVGTYVTALIYLNTVPKPGDGATVFPCAVMGSAADVGNNFRAGASLLREQALHTGESPPMISSRISPGSAWWH